MSIHKGEGSKEVDMEEEERVRVGVVPSVHHIRILLEESMVRSFIFNIVFFLQEMLLCLCPIFWWNSSWWY